MNYRKEKTLIQFKENKLDTKCICLNVLELKATRLKQEYEEAKEKFLSAKTDSIGKERKLNILKKLGNKYRAVKEVILEVKETWRILDEMVEIKSNDKSVFRLSFKSDCERSCKGKIKYREESAEKAKVEMEKKLNEAMDAYKCRHCDGYHVGHAWD